MKQVMPGLQPSSNLASKLHYVCRTEIKVDVSPTDVIKVLKEKGIRLKDDDSHYEIQLPFKQQRPNLPDDKGPVAIICDIKRMFHQFHVKAEEQDYLTFMWCENRN
ncbi:hypothetical protein N1851_024512 [Merluccius polli]|uniref:Uncharacterized protein n=1 Tax=Merluccius polli TaxID=89951 RepID=A0AA47NWU4_MERPO|nr:hypothetical protein N1851_024512 [Merluccius polli]